MTYLERGKNMDSLMKTDPESRMYQHVPMSSGLKEREKERKTKKIKSLTGNKTCLCLTCGLVCCMVREKAADTDTHNINA